MKHILLLSRDQRFGTPDGHQIMPFSMYASKIESNLGLRVINAPAQSPTDRTAAIARFLTKPESKTLAQVIVMPHWSEPVDALCNWFDQTRTRLCRANHSETKMVMLDYYASTSSPHFQTLAHVDRYIKRQTFCDQIGYSNNYKSGHIYADFVAKTWGFDLAGWSIDVEMPPEHAQKLVSGWNLGVTPQYRHVLKWSNRFQVPWKCRQIDIHQRVSGISNPGTDQDWYQFSRTKGVESLKGLSSKYRQTTTGRVPRKRYFLELCMSKVAFSPFGWGEVCFRDYEAIVCGALLVKPDMSHLQTEPNIYIPHETYVPVSWDFSDAAEIVDYYLGHPSQAIRIVKNAQRVLWEYYQSGQFVDAFKRCIDDSGEASREGL